MFPFRAVHTIAGPPQSAAASVFGNKHPPNFPLPTLFYRGGLFRHFGTIHPPNPPDAQLIRCLLNQVLRQRHPRPAGLPKNLCKP